MTPSKPSKIQNALYTDALSCHASKLPVEIDGEMRGRGEGLTVLLPFAF